MADWHFAYLGMEYRHPGRRADCDACESWTLPVAPVEVPS